MNAETGGRLTAEERAESLRALRTELSDAVFKGAIPDLGNPNTGYAQHQITEWIIDSDWFAALHPATSEAP